MSNYHEHQILVQKILVELSKNPNIRVWQNASGVAKSMDDERVIKYGLNGSADIIGIIAPLGKFLAVEIKTGKARQSIQQIKFQEMITTRGGIYILARSISDLDALKAHFS